MLQFVEVMAYIYSCLIYLLIYNRMNPNGDNTCNADNRVPTPTTVKWLRRKNDAKEDITQEHDQAHLINTQTPLQLVLDDDEAKVTCRYVKALKAFFYCKDVEHFVHWYPKSAFTSCRRGLEAVSQWEWWRACARRQLMTHGHSRVW